MTTHRIHVAGTDPASRSTGAALRNSIQAAAEAGSVVTIDLSAVESVSHSFADEAFGVLLMERGEQWFFDHVRLDHAKRPVLINIASAIRLRIEELKHCSQAA